MKNHSIVIVGGGTAGITVAAQLKRKSAGLDIAIVEPSETHYYQPAWTLVGGGAFDVKATARPMSEYIPKGVTWIKDKVARLDPDNDRLELQSGEEVSYEYLVLAPGIQIDWNKIKGLDKALGKGGVCSNYDYKECQYTWEVVKNFKGGVALFTNPNTPIKCGGAPQKIMYLASDNFRKRGLLKDSDIRYMTAGGVIFGIQPYKSSLEKVMDRYGIRPQWHHNLKEIRPDTREAVFDILEKGKPVGEETVVYDMIHVVPPMSAPDFIKESPLGNEKGWLKVDKFSLQSPDYPNVFGLGDAAGTPNAKTGAAIRKQAPVVVENLLHVISQEETDAEYHGYGSCPIITGYGKLILAEFDYDGNRVESFPIDQSKERWSMYQMKKHFLPWMYWNGMLQGRA